MALLVSGMALEDVNLGSLGPSDLEVDVKLSEPYAIHLDVPEGLRPLQKLLRQRRLGT